MFRAGTMRTLLAQPCPPDFSVAEKITRPRLGFLGVDRNGLRSISRRGIVDVAEAFAGVDGARAGADGRESDLLKELLEVGVDGVVIATPGAGQAESAIAALERGVAVFCGTLPGRTSGEISRVIDAARHAN